MVMDYFMKAAFNIAKTADFKFVRPNPLVGAVVVSGDGRILGEGCHEKFGAAHAEVNAIHNALKHTNDLSECTLFVTLEPCSHQGKTPPCTDFIIRNGIKKVVIGSSDPNPLVSGANVLMEAGIDVKVYNDPALIDMNREFYVNHLFQRPYVVLKMAMTIDGKIADRNGNSKWLSNEESRNYVHEHLRTEADAILTTFHTVFKDNAQLNIRKSDGSVHDKDILIIDRDFQLLKPENAGLSIFKSHPHSTIFLFGLHKHLNDIPENVKLIFTDFDQEGNIKLDAMLRMLLEQKHYKILVEAGSKLATQLMIHDCIDEMKLFVVPAVFLDNQAISSFNHDHHVSLLDAKKFQLSGVYQFNSDVLLSYVKNIS